MLPKDYSKRPAGRFFSGIERLREKDTKLQPAKPAIRGYGELARERRGQPVKRQSGPNVREQRLRSAGDGVSRKAA